MYSNLINKIQNEQFQINIANTISYIFKFSYHFNYNSNFCSSLKYLSRLFYA